MDVTEGPIISVLEGGYHTRPTARQGSRNSTRNRRDANGAPLPSGQVSPPPATLASGASLMADWLVVLVVVTQAGEGKKEDAGTGSDEESPRGGAGGEPEGDGGLAKGVAAHLQELFSIKTDMK